MSMTVDGSGQNLRDERDEMRREGEKHASAAGDGEPARHASPDADDDGGSKPETD